MVSDFANAARVKHFGEYLRWHRVTAGKTTDEMARAVGLTPRRWIAIEAMDEPHVQPTTLGLVAKAIGLTVPQLDRAWRTTPVPVTRRKAGPSTDVARQFAAACRAAGVTPVEGLRRLRLWVVGQPKAVQVQAVGFLPPAEVAESADEAEPTFTAAVDHLQDPAAETHRRAAGRARGRPRSTGPAPTPPAQ